MGTHGDDKDDEMNPRKHHLSTGLDLGEERPKLARRWLGRRLLRARRQELDLYLRRTGDAVALDQRFMGKVERGTLPIPTARVREFANAYLYTPETFAPWWAAVRLLDDGFDWDLTVACLGPRLNDLCVPRGTKRAGGTVGGDATRPRGGHDVPPREAATAAGEDAGRDGGGEVWISRGVLWRELREVAGLMGRGGGKREG